MIEIFLQNRRTRFINKCCRMVWRNSQRKHTKKQNIFNKAALSHTHTHTYTGLFRCLFLLFVCFCIYWLFSVGIQFSASAWHREKGRVFIWTKKKLFYIHTYKPIKTASITLLHICVLEYFSITSFKLPLPHICPWSVSPVSSPSFCPFFFVPIYSLSLYP